VPTCNTRVSGPPVTAWKLTFGVSPSRMSSCAPQRLHATCPSRSCSMRLATPPACSERGKVPWPWWTGQGEQGHFPDEHGCLAPRLFPPFAPFTHRWREARTWLGLICSSVTAASSARIFIRASASAMVQASCAATMPDAWWTRLSSCPSGTWPMFTDYKRYAATMRYQHRVGLRIVTLFQHLAVKPPRFAVHHGKRASTRREHG